MTSKLRVSLMDSSLHTSPQSALRTLKLFEETEHLTEGLHSNLILEHDGFGGIIDAHRERIESFRMIFAIEHSELVDEVVLDLQANAANIHLTFYETSPEGDEVISAWEVKGLRPGVVRHDTVIGLSFVTFHPISTKFGTLVLKRARELLRK